jgi:uncharacterized coiled-coil protein SlyX
MALNIQGFTQNILNPDTIPPTVSVVVSFRGYQHPDGKMQTHGRARRQRAVFTKTVNELLSPLETAFKLKKNLSCYPEYFSLEMLADTMGLTRATRYNPKCKFDVGDLTSWSKKAKDIDYYILEFATRKMALDALEKERFTISDDNLQGLLSAIAKEFKEIDKIQSQWQYLKQKYNDCQRSEPVISFPFGDSVFRIRAIRIDEARELISRAPNEDFSQGYLLTLARYYGLPGFGGEYDCNSAFQYSEDDLSWFYNKYNGKPGGAKAIHKEFAARKIIINAADLDNLPCIKLYKHGDVSYMAEEFIIPKL